MSSHTWRSHQLNATLTLHRCQKDEPQQFIHHHGSMTNDDDHRLIHTLLQDLLRLMQLILFSKPGCHLCEGLQEKLEQIQQLGTLDFELKICDITTRPDWFEQFQYEIPVLYWTPSMSAADSFKPIPRPSPRISVTQLTQVLQKYFVVDPAK